MKYQVTAIFFLILVTSCDLFSGDDNEENKRVDFDIDSGIIEKSLDNQLNETSGLIWFNNKIWTHNDGAGNNEIYALDPNGNISLTVEIEGATNIDWEALAQDDDFIYIGDFGNNAGDRTDLKVFKIAKESLQTTESYILVTAEEIRFSYSNQTDFNGPGYQHSFDCEAMVATQNEIILFSKDWKNFKTTVYKLPKVTGDYILDPSDSYDVTGLITGADLSPDSKYLTLLGYSFSLFSPDDLKPFIFLFNYNSDNTFGDKVVFLNLVSLKGNQTEGISFVNNNTLSFSSEKRDNFYQKVYEFSWSDYQKYLD